MVASVPVILPDWIEGAGLLRRRSNPASSSLLLPAREVYIRVEVSHEGLVADYYKSLG
jgi:hypothetical protein